MKTNILLILTLILVAGRAHSLDFRQTQIKLGDQKLTVEVADTDELRQMGLMHRKNLDDGKGMIFIFDREQPQAFWMKNTLIPLSIAFFNSQKKLVDLFDMEPEVSEMVAEPKIYRAKKPAQYALEVPKGWYRKHGVKPGAQFSFEEEKKINSAKNQRK